MRKQTIVKLHLTSGEVDVLTAIARDGGRRETKLTAIIYRLCREYRKVCTAAGIEPSPRFLDSVPDDMYAYLTQRAWLCDTLGDILAAVQDATAPADDFDEDEEGEDTEDEEETEERGWIECTTSIHAFASNAPTAASC